ncbi:MAG: radical SAM protein [Prevotellaceae bacterium]|jgi:wyosine [tRNA(Phe)-imidazoG37] synthetase (radical SAM superfamily)|nr:radical SAM protein [Prevotellaceae bacterium]
MYFSDIIFGPVQSRRLGVSLGINLLPLHGKWCNFDCIYCECGWNREGLADKQLPSRADVCGALEARLQMLAAGKKLPDAITFSGNGEPTIHPEFAGIVDDVVALRNRFAPTARVCALSNATTLMREEVFAALQKTDCPILKLDAAVTSTAKRMNNPVGDYTVEQVVAAMQRFHHNFILQTMFLRGDCQGSFIDNTTPEEVTRWLEVVALLRPREVMIYTIDRETPVQGLRKIPLHELEQIAVKVRQMGVPVRVSG